MENQTKSPDNSGPFSEAVVTLLRYFFHTHFCPEKSIAADRKHEVLPAYFYGWLDQRMDAAVPADACAAAGLPDVAGWEALREILASGLAVERLAVAWFHVVLHERPLPKYALQSVNLVLNLTWADKTVLTTQAFVPVELLSGGVFTDALVAAIVDRHVRMFAAGFAGPGLDALHDDAAAVSLASPAAEDAFEAVMGTFLIHVLPRFKPELRPAAERVVRLMQQCVRPPVPPEAQAHFQNELRRRQAGPQALGGWDV